MRRRDPDLLPPPTLGDLAHDVAGVFCWCNRCFHNAVLPLDILIARLGPALPFPHAQAHLRCQACGARDVDARPDWPKIGQVASHGPSRPRLRETADAEAPAAARPRV